MQMSPFLNYQVLEKQDRILPETSAT